MEFKDKKEALKYSDYLKNYRVCITLVGASMTMFLLYFLDGIISENLLVVFGLDGDVVGYVFVPPLLVFVLMCPVIGMISKKIESRVCIVFAYNLTTLGIFCTGPS